MVSADDPSGMSNSDLAALRTQLVAVVRARVPEPDVEDVVQATLADAVAAVKKPAEPGERRAWVFGIARHKIADYHRGRKRNRADSDETDLPDSAPRHSERDLLRWAERALPQGEDAKQTLEWMLQEGDGEKLEEIANRARVPAPTVRKRVSRLREHLRAQWKKELALVFAAAVLGIAVYLLGREKGPEARHPVPAPTLSALPPQEMARGLRIEALGKCERAEYTECLQMLDRAKIMDPAGDLAPEVSTARAAADARLRTPSPPPSSLPMPVPTGSSTLQTPPPSSAAPSPSPTPLPTSPTSPTSTAPAPRGSGTPKPPSRPTGLSTPPTPPSERLGTGGSSAGSGSSL
jgi:RNA polymerase sigma factor (sigma-70 family)